MSNPRAFISFDFDNDSDYRTLFSGQIKNSRTPFNIEDWSSKTVLPEKKWQEMIEEKIKKCNMVIVLVGKRTANAKGVLKEIEFASKSNIPVFGIYVGDANTLTELPSGMLRSRTVVWDWEKIADMVKQCMVEGKNK